MAAGSVGVAAARSPPVAVLREPQDVPIEIGFRRSSLFNLIHFMFHSF